MIDLLVTNTIISSNSKKHYYYYVLGNFDLMIKVSTSWSKLWKYYCEFWSHEQIEFWPHEQMNFDLMKFDLMIIPRLD